MSKNEDKDKLKLVSSNSTKLITNSKSKKFDQLIKSQKMTNFRILQKNLVYVIGLSEKLANKDLLNKYEYFGQYGQISKIVVNKNKAYYAENSTKPSYSAYISYTSPEEASLAILAIDSIIADDSLIRASFGTTKYCTFYLKNADCTNKDCLYLHSVAEDEVIVNKDELTSNTIANNLSSNSASKNVFYEQHLLAIKLTNLYDKEVRVKLANQSQKKTVLPNLESIYDKDIVIENDPEFVKKFRTPNFKSKNQIPFKQTQSNSLSTTPKGKSNNEKINENKIIITNSNSSNNSGNEDNKSSEDKNDNFILNKLTNNFSTPANKQSLYRNRDKSRFPFVNELEGSQSLKKSSSASEGHFTTIPEYIFEVINKKASRFTFFKKFENEFEIEKDRIYFEKTLKCKERNDSWTDFIFTNINLQENN